MPAGNAEKAEEANAQRRTGEISAFQIFALEIRLA
jgi:hypothetical protein